MICENHKRVEHFMEEQIKLNMEFNKLSVWLKVGAFGNMLGYIGVIIAIITKGI
jgi:hypothetical protein